MLSRYASDWKDRLRARLREAGIGSSRPHHDGNGWMHVPAEDRRQPQDGAPKAAGKVLPSPVLHFSRSAPHLERGLLMEPEDARITGSTRSLTRRLMGLNIARPSAAPQPIQVAPRPALAERRKSPVMPVRAA